MYNHDKQNACFVISYHSWCLERCKQKDECSKYDFTSYYRSPIAVPLASIQRSLEV